MRSPPTKEYIDLITRVIRRNEANKNIESPSPELQHRTAVKTTFVLAATARPLSGRLLELTVY